MFGHTFSYYTHSCIALTYLKHLYNRGLIKRLRASYDSYDAGSS